MNAFRHAHLLAIGSLILASTLFSPFINAKIDIAPSVTARETFSDNIGQNTQQDSVLVTEVTPSVSVVSDGARSDFNLNYKMQNLNFIGDQNGGNTNHSLSLGTTNELIEDWFYLDGETSFGQRIIGAGSALGTDNLNQINNRSDLTTYRVAPRLQHRFGRNHSVLLGYEYAQAAYDNNLTSDSSSERSQFRWLGQTQSSLVNWSVGYDDLALDREFGSDSFSEITTAQMGLRATSTVQLIVRGGTSKSDIPDAGLSVDGDYYSGGIIFTPSRKLQLSVFGGENDSEARVSFSPTPRSSFRVIYRDRAVGLNPGESWSLALSHQARRVKFDLSYNESVTSEQILQVEGARFVVDVDPLTGLLVTDPITGRPAPPRLVLDIGVADTEFLRKRGVLGIHYEKRRHNISFSLFQEERIRPALNSIDDLQGAQFNWNWQLNSNSQLVWSVLQEKNEFATFASAFDRTFVPVTYIRTINPSLTFSSGISHLQQRSDVGVIEFDENRLFASIVKRY